MLFEIAAIAQEMETDFPHLVLNDSANDITADDVKNMFVVFLKGKRAAAAKFAYV